MSSQAALFLFLLSGGMDPLPAVSQTSADSAPGAPSSDGPESAALAPENPLPAWKPAAGQSHRWELDFEGQRRSAMVYLPRQWDSSRPAPLMLVIHGAMMNAQMMAGFSGMNQQADAAGFIAVYPNGTGPAEPMLVWNSGGVGPLREKPDDVGFLRVLLEQLEQKLKVDPRRIYAAGMSNGGMMCYRLAAELPDRIAAIAAVGGTLALPKLLPGRPVPLIHFHGTDDRIVPYEGPARPAADGSSFQSVRQSIATWVTRTECPAVPRVEEVPDRYKDSTRVRISRYGPGKAGSEVVLVDIIGGGHTWPGQQPAVSLIGKSTREVSANAMIWDFFQRHPLPASPP